ncbi:outer membrane protein assembly factor BamD [Mesonia maritima]|uniref:Outer membrane protein assembly factor BamD n=1 Tax=Mesonia maritima TaxID=1793873 RepID=A0ABU1K3X8_9FLAO|nr:outer membrane protein assembly factor BamD [Mesonia maritima]MDR6300323.1 outer membrane protein assembly factor BamD [Mesonia maritima]
MMRKSSVVILIALIISSCSPYQKVLKNEEIKPKYEMAVKLYEEGLETGKNNRFKKTLQLLEQILPQYRGTPQGEKISFIYADSYYQLEDYFDAGYQFERFTKAYPTSEKAGEAAFKSAKSYYYVSPRYSLDQTETYKGIEKLQDYITRYPDGENVAEANTLLSELREKLEKKAFEIARQYYHIEDYKASIAAMDNFIESYPGSKYIESAYFHKLDAAYLLAINSYQYLVEERLETASEYYEDYEKYYAEGEFSTKASEISADINQRLKNF